MKPGEIGAGEFKTRCLKLIDQVAATGDALTITKRGKPVARLVPMPAEPGLFGALAGSVLAQHRITEPLDEPWDADR